MRIALTMSLEPDDSAVTSDPIAEQDLPWFDAGDTGGMLEVDGKRRIPRKSKDAS